jgi:glycosyltransferase involved in cell wall biosynthesis
MRVLQVITRRQHRGAEVFATDLADSLQDRGHEVTVLGLLPPPAQALRPLKASSADLFASGQGVVNLRRVRELARLFLCESPDVIHANGGNAMKYAVLAKRWSRGHWPIVYCNIGLSSDWLRKLGQRAWYGWILRQASVTAAVSAASRTDLIKTYGLDPVSVEVVRRGVVMDAFDVVAARQALRRELDVPEDSKVLLHVGSFTPEKNHAGLLRIAERVRSEHRDVHLVLVGDGPGRAEIEAQAARLGRVHLLGVRSDVPRRMAGADILLLPSLTEGIPGVILEAGAQSVPSVAYDIGGVGEAIRDGETGRLIPFGEEAAFVKAVADLLADTPKRRAMGAQARAFIEANYSLEQSVDRFERLYRQLVAI